MTGTLGFASISESNEASLIWGGTRNQTGVLNAPHKTFSSTLTDAANSPTTDIRPGLLLAEDSTLGELVAWDASSATASRIYGVNVLDFSTLDDNGTAEDKTSAIPPIMRAPLKASQLLIKGAALVGHTDEYEARRQLAELGCVLDDDIGNTKSGIAERIIVKTADYPVVAADNGATFTTRGAGAAVEFTLPALKRGLHFTFINEANQDMKITAETADTLVVFNDLDADSVSLETTDDKTGGTFEVMANDDASKFIVKPILWGSDGVIVQTVTIAT